MTNYCTCRPGRDYDGSEFGPCEYCERMDDKTRAEMAIIRDAARWRISQIVYPRIMDTPQGYFHIDYLDGDFSVGIQPHPVTKTEVLTHCILGRGKSEGEAIDKMLAKLRAYSVKCALTPEIESILSLLDEVEP